MAESTGIEWTDATVNFWWGCTKVGPGCDHCYAEAWTKRTGDQVFGAGVPRRKIKGAVSLLYRLHNGASWWAADAYIGKLHPNGVRRVFVQSMSDLFDKEVPAKWFDEAWHAISACNKLEIQIVTKRVSLVEKRLAGKPWPKHAGLIISVVNQVEADRDIPRLLELKAKLGIPWVGVSLEPLLGAVDLRRVCIVPKVPGSSRAGVHIDALVGRYVESGQSYIGAWDVNGPYPEGAPALALDWVIVGGESGKCARPIHPEWARSLRDQCAATGVSFLFKQWGEWAPVSESDTDSLDLFRPRLRRREPEGPQRCKVGQLVMQASGRIFPMDEWSRTFGEDLDAGDFAYAAGAGAMQFMAVGKHRSGRLLDGVEHNGFPTVPQENTA